MGKETVLFICSFNSVRSRIAEGLLAARCGERFDVSSAGIAPAPLNPNAAEVMREVGIDITGRKPVPVTSLRQREFDYIVTLCDHARDANIPLPKGKKTFHHHFTSPCEIREQKEEVLADFRKLRDRIDAYLSDLFPCYLKFGSLASENPRPGSPENFAGSRGLTGKAGGRL
jgi:arsenate reductase